MGVKIPFEFQAYQNGSLVRVKSYRFSWDAKKSVGVWGLDFKEPLQCGVGDLWDIYLGLAGKAWPRVIGGKALSIRSDRGVSTHSVSVSSDGSKDETQELLNLGVPWTMCFINWNWLMSVDDTARIENGVVIGNGLGRSGSRLFHPALPAKEIEPANQLCINGPTTHRDCAAYLARMLGFDFVTNCIRMDVQDTFTIPSGTTWLQAITSNFEFWNPTVNIVPADPNVPYSRPTIYVLDAEGADAQLQPVQVIEINDPVITNVQTEDTRTYDKTVDHLIVIGRNFQNVTNQWGEPNLIPVTYTPKNFSVDKTITSPPILYALPIEKIKSFIGGGLYEGKFGKGSGEFKPDPPSHQIVSIDYHIDRTVNGERWMVLGQTSSVYGLSGDKLSEQVTVYKYAPNKKLIETYVDDYAKVWTYNVSTKALESSWDWIKQKSTFQDSFSNAPELTMTREFTVEMVVVTAKGGKYMEPKRLGDLLRNNSSRDALDSTQTRIKMMTTAKWSEISRADRQTLIKRECEYDYLSGSSKFQDQPLQNPIKDRMGKPQDTPFRREYFKPGAGVTIPGSSQKIYHPAKTIKHRDIVSDEIAEILKNREFRRSGDGFSPSNLKVTVKVAIPLPILSMALSVQLQDSSWIVNGDEVPVPGGLYYLKSFSENSASGDGGPVTYDGSLTVTEHW
jgi:hypothetical protein